MQSGNKSKTGDGNTQLTVTTPTNGTQTCHAARVAQIATESTTSLSKLWRSLGVSRDDQAREENALLRDVKSLYERKVQLYQDEYELSSKRITVLQCEIAHIHWLFRDDEPHEFGDENAYSIRDQLASLEIKFKCLDQLRESRVHKLSALEDELSQLLMRAGEDDWRQEPDDDPTENLSEVKILSFQTRVDRLRPLVEGLAKKIAEDSTACGKIVLQLGMTELLDFDRSLLHADQKLNTTLQHSVKVSARLRDLQLAVDEAQPLWKLIEKRESILLERREYDSTIHDSLRLTSRSGEAGRLLREEKLRKKINKSLPKVTSYLEKNIAAWEQKHAMQFFWGGNAYLSHMRAADSDYEVKAEKEREKKIRSQQLMRSTSASIGSHDEKTATIRLRRRNSVSSESVPTVAAASRRRRFSVRSEHTAFA